MKNVEEGPGELVVPGCDGAMDFELADHALDAIALAIDAPVPTDRSFPGAFRRYARTDAGILQHRPDGVGVVALVGNQIGGLFVGQGHYVFERGAVGRLAGREVEDERDASGITETMNLTGEPAPRAAKRLFASPPFAPAAET